MATGDAGSGPTKSGFVLFHSFLAMQPSGTPVSGGDAQATFSTVPVIEPAPEEHGPCTIYDGKAGAASGASAGTITIGGGSVMVSLVPFADQTYPYFSTAQQCFSGGETLSFVATGADVPSFKGSLTAPAKAEITSPAKPQAASPFLIISRAQRFDIQWTGGGAGQVEVGLFGETGRSLLIFCRFPAALGHGSIPAEVLAAIPAGNGGFSMTTVATAPVTAGDWQVGLNAAFNAVWPDRTIVSGPAKYQ